ncbi:Maf family nucleotide pyrophosphatase [Cyclobacterium marinum]|uniref:dTTP/UTP pyrophosphatase n=1 Tax=Cyclobacterium marinum (strain ATCC 25205 / DSM 745 / LMG 13164 / NCIMB 1802) TaxID=880070 RepID=G0IXR8_CYCMS|nr:Maf family nucleotide pyrophosphatase [Cyclobacterium marinum]AEL28065.1 Septum formation protein Maf [Cyclobacterium marinum DSM 745]MBI0397835.1 septum formation protein Maf [Cyclobacterium marinum]MBR9777094.1 septum formation protein Maf [Cytophagales bacterium]
MKIIDKTIILSSNSPRRQQLLRDLGFSFEVKTMHTDESFPADMEATRVAAYLAEKKANTFLPHLKDQQVLITADTIVIANQTILNKPQNEEEAINMLHSINGKSHMVVTGVCIVDTNKKTTFSDLTEVTFSKLSEEEISFYVRTFKPYDKAGAYGIQEWIGMVGIDNINGSYYNVMGLPVNLVYKSLKSNYTLSL